MTSVSTSSTQPSASPRRARPSLGSLQQRIASEQARLNRGVSDGTLTQVEATALQARLTQAQQNLQRDAFDGNGLSQGKRADKALRGIGRAITRDVRNDQVDLPRRAADLEARIGAGLNDGTLAPAEANALTVKVQGLRNEQATATTPAAQKRVAHQLQALSHQLDGLRRDSRVNTSLRVADCTTRIAAGLADGTLTPAQAAALTARLPAPGVAPSPRQLETLSRAITALRARLDARAP